ncbi:MAG: metallophosphoesterase [Myxococcales bacterium]|nr:metallophosphoesterase [Myxococcales bacterium]
MDRRRFLIRSAQVGAVLALGCQGPDDEATADTRVPPAAPSDAQVPDAAVVADDAIDAALDAPPPDALPADAIVDAIDRVQWPEHPFSKGPWSFIGAEGEVVVRFETLDPTPVPVRLEVDGVAGVEVMPSVSTQWVEYTWPPFETTLPVTDRPGEYSLQEARFHGLAPGLRHRYSVGPLQGTLRTPPMSGEPFRLAFVADTMAPFFEDVVAKVVEAEPDLLLHGGDIVYQTNPIDTWTGFYRAFAPALRGMAFHACMGNHENEGQDELSVQSLRLLSGQGAPGDAAVGDYHAFTYGGVRFLMLNSERDFDDEGQQIAWLRAELEAVDADPALRFAIAAFHRPFFTFGAEPNLGTRTRVHGLFAAHRVPLVLTGHLHSYERFAADGVTYIVDGGGGGLLSSPDEARDAIAEARPDELDLRFAATMTWGATFIDVGAQALTGWRVNVDGVEEDRFEIAL